MLNTVTVCSSISNASFNSSLYAHRLTELNKMTEIVERCKLIAASGFRQFARNSPKWRDLQRIRCHGRAASVGGYDDDDEHYNPDICPICRWTRIIRD